MSDSFKIEDLTFYVYDPPPVVPAGVTRGHLVIWSGKPGPAHVVEVGQIHDGHGGIEMVQMGDVRPTNVVDD